MRTSFQLLPLALAAALQMAPAARARTIEMVAVAEHTKLGAAVQPPNANHPAFYVAYDGGYIEAGDSIAGHKPPAPTAVGQALRQALATQGYQPAPDGVSPSLLLTYNWGSINIDTRNPSPTGKLQPNFKARIYLVGTGLEAGMIEYLYLHPGQYPVPAALWGPLPGPIERRDLMRLAADDRYFVIVSAYDYAAIVRQQPALLWRVRMSARSVSSHMYEVLPTLINGGAPYFGRNLDKALRVRIPLLPAPAGAADPMPQPPPAIVRQLDAAFVGKLVQQEHGLFAGEDVLDPAAPHRVLAAADTSAAGLPAALKQEIAGYRQEKLALEEALIARIKAQPTGSDFRAIIDSFQRDYGDRIAALARSREAIRDQLSRLAAANSDPAAANSLNALLKEYTSDIRILAPPAAGRSP